MDVGSVMLSDTRDVRGKGKQLNLSMQLYYPNHTTISKKSRVQFFVLDENGNLRSNTRAKKACHKGVVNLNLRNTKEEKLRRVEHGALDA